MREKADGGRSVGFSYGAGPSADRRGGTPRAPDSGGTKSVTALSGGKAGRAGDYSFCFRYRLGLMP